MNKLLLLAIDETRRLADEMRDLHSRYGRGVPGYSEPAPQEEKHQIDLQITGLHIRHGDWCEAMRDAIQEFEDRDE